MDMFLLFELINSPLARIGVSVDCPNVGLPPYFSEALGERADVAI